MKKLTAVILCCLLLCVFAVPCLAAEEKPVEAAPTEATGQSFYSGVMSKIAFSLMSSTTSNLISAGNDPDDPNDVAGAIVNFLDPNAKHFEEMKQSLDRMQASLDQMQDQLDAVSTGVEVLLDGQTIVINELGAIIINLLDVERQTQLRFASIENDLNEISSKISATTFNQYMNRLEKINGQTKDVWTQYLYLAYRSYLLTDGASDTVTVTTAGGATSTFSLNARLTELFGSAWTAQQSLWNSNAENFDRLFPALAGHDWTEQERDMILWSYLADTWNTTLCETYIPHTAVYTGTDDNFYNMLVDLDVIMDSGQSPSLIEVQRDMLVPLYPYDHQCRDMLLDSFQYGTNLEARLYLMYLEFANLYDADAENAAAYSTAVSACTNTIANLNSQSAASKIYSMLGPEDLEVSYMDPNEPNVNNAAQYYRIRTLESSTTESVTYLVREQLRSIYYATDGYLYDSPKEYLAGADDPDGSAVLPEKIRFYTPYPHFSIIDNGRYRLVEGLNGDLPLAPLWAGSDPAVHSLYEYLQDTLGIEFVWKSETHVDGWGEVHFYEHGDAAYLFTPLGTMPQSATIDSDGKELHNGTVTYLDFHGQPVVIDAATTHSNFHTTSDPLAMHVYVDVAHESWVKLAEAGLTDGERLTPTSFSQFAPYFTIDSGTVLDLSKLAGQSGEVTIHVAGDATITTGGKAVSGVNIVVYDGVDLTLDNCHLTGAADTVLLLDGGDSTLTLRGENTLTASPAYNDPTDGLTYGTQRSVVAGRLMDQKYYSGATADSRYRVSYLGGLTNVCHANLVITGNGSLTLDGADRAKYGLLLQYPYSTYGNLTVSTGATLHTVGCETGVQSRTTAGATFTDVKSGDWFADSAEYMVSRDLMRGTGAQTFTPQGLVDRATAATILHRLAGSPPVSTTSTLPKDVAANTWYSDGIIWNSEKGIMRGYVGGLFKPFESATREQLATILHRYAEVMGLESGARADLSTFADGAKVSVFARESMQWAVGSKLIKGKTGGLLDPQGEISRAECAVIFTRFCQQIAK